MRTVLGSLWFLSSLGVVSLAAMSCKAPCSETDSCGTYVPPLGGSGNDGGTGAGAGAPPTGGTAGRGGAAGSGGTAGDLPGGAAGEGEGGAGGGSVPCDATKDPTTEACLVDDDHAVFVAPNGKDDAAGTKSAPVATLSKAVALAAGSKFVLVCNATYDQHVTVSAAAQIYGGFKCSDWSPENDAPLFKPSTAGPALRIDAVTEPVAITSIDFEVGDATTSGETALTAIVNASPKVTFDGVSFKAGKGKTGAAGSLSEFVFPDPATLNGNAETAPGVGGGEHVCVCQASLQTVGGVGGTPSSSGQNGSKGLPDLGGGLGGDPTSGDCGSGSSGKKGANGVATMPAAGAATLGSLTATGWVPTSGANGPPGSPGQGGGGGASLNGSGHGGGGGCGGCGGNGATAGKGGGGSIALLLLDSPVQIHASTLMTSDAGDGGNGSAGQPGQSDIGAGGGVVSSINSCPGGNGGKGANGGASGGGGGGISVGIVWKGANAPTVTGTTTTTGKPGAAGIGGVPGTNDGIAGVKQDVLQLP